MTTEYDDREFLRNMRRLEKEIMPEAVQFGLGQAALQLLNFTMTEEPTVPIDEGFLRGSASIFVNKEVIHQGSGEHPQDFVIEDHDIEKKQHEQFSLVTFNTPYAARLELNPDFNFSQEGEAAGAGGFYLGSKVQRHERDLFQIVADGSKQFMDQAK